MPRKEVWLRFQQKIPTENMFFGKDETSHWDSFAPNRAIKSVWPIKLVRCDLVQKFKPKTSFLEKRIWEGFWGKIEQCFSPEQLCPRMHRIANYAQKRGMGPVSSKNPDWKRVFWEGRNFAPEHFCPQSRHVVRLAIKIGDVRFSIRIPTVNVFFGKTNSRGLLRQN